MVIRTPEFIKKTDLTDIRYLMCLKMKKYKVPLVNNSNFFGLCWFSQSPDSDVRFQINRQKILFALRRASAREKCSPPNQPALAGKPGEV